jgi:hypothetical protein
MGEGYLIAGRIQLREGNLSVTPDAEGRGAVELDFDAGIRAGSKVVAGNDGSVQRSRHPFTGVAALNGNLTMDQADAGHSALQIVRILSAGGNHQAGGKESHSGTAQKPRRSKNSHEQCPGLPGQKCNTATKPKKLCLSAVTEIVPASHWPKTTNSGCVESLML